MSETLQLYLMCQLRSPEHAHRMQYEAIHFSSITSCINVRDVYKYINGHMYVCVSVCVFPLVIHILLMINGTTCLA